VDNIGLPISGTNMSYNNSGTIGTTDADLMLTFDPDRVANSDPMMAILREQLPREFPGVSFAMLPADIVTQILNFGLPAPLDIQAIGVDRDKNRAYLEKIFQRLSRVPASPIRVFSRPIIFRRSLSMSTARWRKRSGLRKRM